MNDLPGKEGERTCRAYRDDLEHFRDYLRSHTVDDAARALLRHKHGDANALVLAYRARLLQAGLAPATVNRKLATLRSLVKRARLLGIVAWTLEVQNVKSQAYRDTRGTGRKGFERLFAVYQLRSRA